MSDTPRSKSDKVADALSQIPRPARVQLMAEVALEKIGGAAAIVLVIEDSPGRGRPGVSACESHIGVTPDLKMPHGLTAAEHLLKTLDRMIEGAHCPCPPCNEARARLAAALRILAGGHASAADVVRH